MPTGSCQVSTAIENSSTCSCRDSGAEGFNRRGAGHLPGLVGLEVLSVALFHCTHTVLWPSHRGGKLPNGPPRDSMRDEVDAMNRWFYGFFFFSPRLLAEGNG